ncbi:5'/3'-nucleotidase SurE [Clostridium sp. ZS2-4]|uniref:5'/3'-nucleotidase SurE n=1 Tax=Clostridium sp. ZS2-4 TaxID=2987703 RepID=UPI00227A7C5E|nr:5'/3'-nucleotidase SurE [Clostridium sp. ZS2-4]MCY6354222.1 hypothetical protein [Clostridium sp. ZS2-4]
MLKKQVLSNRKPFVLITNDDGIESPGLHALLEIVERKPDYCISGINYGKNLGLAFTCI